MPADTLTRIRARGHIGIRLGLARMQALLAELDDPQESLRGVLIGGTNGKGSVAAMVASVMRSAGHSTGQSPSPHLQSYCERVTIDEQPIARDDLDDVLADVLAASVPGEPEHGPATEFELLTAAAYLWSARVGVDVMIMEVGLGGRMDASNSWDADVAAVTNVGLDHQAYLGDTVAAVAAEKAAIMKPGGLAVTGAAGAALRVIEGRALEIGVPLMVCPPLPVLGADRTGVILLHRDRGELRVPLLGRHQAANAAVAIGIIDALATAGVATTPPVAIREGLAATSWPGRLELGEHDGVTFLLDGAHNPDGIASLVATIDELAPELPSGNATLLVGMMADKEVVEMLTLLAGSDTLRHARFIATAVPETDRSMPPGELAARWQRIAGGPAIGMADADEALRMALDATAEQGGPLIVAGSLYLVGHLRGQLVPGDGDRDA